MKEQDSVVTVGHLCRPLFSVRLLSGLCQNRSWVRCISPDGIQFSPSRSSLFLFLCCFPLFMYSWKVYLISGVKYASLICSTDAKRTDQRTAAMNFAFLFFTFYPAEIRSIRFSRIVCLIRTKDKFPHRCWTCFLKRGVDWLLSQYEAWPSDPEWSGMSQTQRVTKKGYLCTCFSVVTLSVCPVNTLQICESGDTCTYNVIPRQTLYVRTTLRLRGW